MRWFNLFRANTRKVYIELKRYSLNTLSMMLTFYIIFLGMFFGITFMASPETVASNLQYAIVNYIFWFLAIVVTDFFGWQIVNEALRGTLEQVYMSPVGAWRVLMARQIGSFLIHFVLIIALLFAAMFTSGQWLNLDVITIFPILLFTLLSLFGFAFLLGGLAIIFKQVQAVLQIIQFILAGLAFIPLSVSPLFNLAPFMKGLDMMRKVMIEDYTLLNFNVIDYSLLIGNAIAYFFIGLWLFKRCEIVAMRKGLLGHY